ncbi:MAG: YihY/virulence factor BrkB family protein, partial [Vicinamibacterales bacterium]|nr:YihY/virulence factor BrkB family protein [Vicinamibacterales bacterium]
VFSAITTAMNYAWRVEQQPSYLKHKLVSLLMMAAAGVLTFLALMVVSVQGIVGASWFTAALEGAPALTWATGVLANWTTTLLLVLIVGLVFYFVPNTDVRFRDVWAGALITGLLWRLALDAFSWYVRDLSRFSIHGSIAAVIVFLIWVYLWAIILMFGAEYTVAYTRLRAKHRPSE